MWRCVFLFYAYNKWIIEYTHAAHSNKYADSMFYMRSWCREKKNISIATFKLIPRHVITHAWLIIRTGVVVLFFFGVESNLHKDLFVHVSMRSIYFPFGFFPLSSFCLCVRVIRLLMMLWRWWRYSIWDAQRHNVCAIEGKSNNFL